TEPSTSLTRARPRNIGSKKDARWISLKMRPCPLPCATPCREKCRRWNRPTPLQHKLPKVILLAAGRGRRFGHRTARLPKCLIPIGPRGENLLSRYLDSFRKLGIRDVVLVIGHEKEKIVRQCMELGRGLYIKFLLNRDYKKGSIVSLERASDEMTEDCL